MTAGRQIDSGRKNQIKNGNGDVSSSCSPRKNGKINDGMAHSSLVKEHRIIQMKDEIKKTGK
jgi:hypothetical protein